MKTYFQVSDWSTKTVWFVDTSVISLEEFTMRCFFDRDCLAEMVIENGTVTKSRNFLIA